MLSFMLLLIVFKEDLPISKKAILRELGTIKDSPINIYEENSGAIVLSNEHSQNI